MKYLSFYIIFLGMYIICFGGCSTHWKEISWKAILGSLWDSLGYALGMFGIFAMLLLVVVNLNEAIK